MAKSEIAEIGKYKILGQIGEGAMGVVYRALDPVLNRPVAIKVMSDALARDTDLRGRFLREAQSAGSLQHPNIITIYDFGEVDGHPFIAMEFVEGADLNELLEQKTPMTLVEKLDVLIDVLNGLAFAHKRGIVHRDIKPGNIRIDGDGRARVMDFGIAHLNSSTMTRTGVMVGTPAYMSPEQITGGDVSPASDLFAVGAVMYELLVGAQAFRGESLQTVMYKIVSAPAPEIKIAVTSLAPDRGASVTRSLNAIAAKAMAKEVSDRYASAPDMASALSDVRMHLLDDDDPIRTTSLRATVAKAMANTQKAGIRERRNHATLLAGAAVLVLVLVPAFVFWTRSHAILAPAPAAESTPAPGPPPSAPASAAAPPALTPPVLTPPALTPPAKMATSSAPSTRELSVLRSLQSAALEARRRAIDAGASAGQLSGGDEHNRLANALARQGKTAEAGNHLGVATAQWSASERTVRTASVAAAQTARATNAEAPRQQVVAATPAVVSAPVQQAAVVPPAPSPQPASNAAAEIGAAVAAYVRALESRDVGAVRRAYPGITPAQAKGWEQFFGTLQTLRASLSVNGLEVNGGSAEARLVGTYDYVTGGGKSAQQAVAFQAAFRREGSAWQLVSVH